MDRGAWQAAVHRAAELGTTEHLSTLLNGSKPVEQTALTGSLLCAWPSAKSRWGQIRGQHHFQEAPTMH